MTLGEDRRHEGPVSGIEHFFKRLFGGSDEPEEIGHYHEAVRRGGALLSVDVADETSVERVRDALYAEGAVDIDSRVAQWRSAGYTGYDRNAPAYTADEIAAERQGVSGRPGNAGSRQARGADGRRSRLFARDGNAGQRIRQSA